jgi:biotin carboxyl carrier protein
MPIKTVEAPIPGTFYRKPAPDQPFFKEEGDAVSVGDTLGLIEVMKTFSSVVAEDAGRLVSFHVDDNDAVMAGQPLYDIEV